MLILLFLMKIQFLLLLKKFFKKRKILRKKYINPNDTASFVDFDGINGEDVFNWTTCMYEWCSQSEADACC